ncbi:hypothetical protein GGR58DRAFT_135786 [Xylaria digitata]|nr:hypothetical protein GGR58DRAFT_135786 [Xylaria digitata]
MTEMSPEVWAAANLDPVSPAPVHLPSPIIVPALQDQADAYFDMSLSSSNPIILNVEAAPGTSKVDERTHVPAATVHNSKPNGTPDTRMVDLQNAAPDKASNGMAKRETATSVRVDAESIMQEPETSQPDTAEAKQDVSMPTASTPNPDVSALVSAQLDIAASAHGKSPSISQALFARDPVPFPRQIPQSPPSLPQNSQAVPDTIVSNGINGKHSLSNNNHPSPTSLADYSVTNIQALVDNITAHTNDVTQNHASRSTCISNALPQCAPLRPKPLTTEQAYTQPCHPANISSEAFQSSSTPLPSSQALHDCVAAALKLIPYASDTLVPTSVTPGPIAIPTSQSDSTFGELTTDRPQPPNYQTWDAFLQDERQYTSDAKWNLFPNGSRIFVGNLSSERVTKREVFDLFSKYGRLAQISLKQSFGFVQYHTVADGQAAIQGLQGAELGGKKINLELSREQKKDGEGNRTNRGKRDHDRQNGNRGRRSNHRARPSHDSNNRDQGDRCRSLSPGYDIHNTYRRRDISPYRLQHTPVHDQSPSPRFRAEVPDVLFLLQDVTPDFVSWVRRAFVDLDLSVDIIYLSPHLTRDEAIRHRVVEGVRAVVDLDPHAQRQGVIPLLMFDRRDGPRGRYNLWQDLTPVTAAQLVGTARSQSQTSTSYHQGLHAPEYFTPSTQGHYMPPSYPSHSYPSFSASSAGHAIPGTAAVSRFPEPTRGWQSSSQPHNGRPTVAVDTLPATPGTIHRGTGETPPNYHDMNYMQPQPNLPSGALHAGDPVQRVRDILTQLAGDGL